MSRTDFRKTVDRFVYAPHSMGRVDPFGELHHSLLAIAHPGTLYLGLHLRSLSLQIGEVLFQVRCEFRRPRHRLLHKLFDRPILLAQLLQSLDDDVFQRLRRHIRHGVEVQLCCKILNRMALFGMLDLVDLVHMKSRKVCARVSRYVVPVWLNPCWHGVCGEACASKFLKPGSSHEVLRWMNSRDPARRCTARKCLLEALVHGSRFGCRIWLIRPPTGDRD